eukprot:8149875-Pyramimonas_sp.AAC.1
MQSNANNAKHCVAMQSNAEQNKATRRSARHCSAMQSNAAQRAMQSQATQCRTMQIDMKPCATA